MFGRAVEVPVEAGLIDLPVQARFTKSGMLGRYR